MKHEVAPSDQGSGERHATQSVHQSWAYRWRLDLTTACVLPAIIHRLVSPSDAWKIWSSDTNQTPLAIGILLAGIGLRIWSAACLCGYKNQKIVDVGPYSLCRNPLYHGTFLIVMGFVVLLNSIPLALAIVPPVLLYLWGVVPAEEQWLKHLQGSVYQDYCERVPRWIPRLTGFKLRPNDAPLAQGFWAEMQGAGWWVLLFAVFSQFGSEDRRADFTDRYIGHSVQIAPASPSPHPVLTTRDIPLRCFVIGDWGSGRDIQRRVAQSMALIAKMEHPQFVVTTGDNFYPHGIESVDDPRWQTVFENIYHTAELQIPWFVSLGNHDHQSSIHAEIAYSDKSSRWKIPASYYRFSRTSGDVRVDFFVLDTESMANGTPGELDRQAAWLDAEMSRSSAPWKVCVGHHPLRSYGRSGDTPFMVETIKPILDRQHASIYLCGHDHDLQSIQNPDDQFLCVVSGAGGKARNTGYGAHTHFAATNGGFVSLGWTKSLCEVEFFDSLGMLSHSESIANASH